MDNVKIPSGRFALSVDEAAQLVGVTRPTLYQEIKSGRLRTFKIAKRRLITPDSLRAWTKEREEAEAEAHAAKEKALPHVAA